MRTKFAAWSGARYLAVATCRVYGGVEIVPFNAPTHAVHKFKNTTGKEVIPTVAINRQMYEATFKVARANPGVKIDLEHSSLHELLLIHPKLNRYWSISNKGEVRRVVPK